jgi:branched-chain amino acid transport system permease protein
MTLFALTLFSMPLWATDYVMAMACILGIHVIATLGLNITTGNTGLISLSHGAFIGVGCYIVAWLAKEGMPFYVTIPAAGLATALLGVLVGLPSLRVKGIYLAIATLAAHFVLTFIFREWESVTGGIPGTSIPRAELFGYKLAGDRTKFYLIFTCAFVLAIAARNLARTYIGRAFVAVRDRDISAEILGINLLKTKLLSFAIGAFYAGIAGALLGYFYGAITPEYFSLTLSVFYLAAVIVGGLGTVLGSVLGALFMTFVPEVLRLMVHASTQLLPRVAGLLLPMQQVVFGVLIIGFLILEPHGLAAIWGRIRRAFHLWPFRT